MPFLTLLKSELISVSFNSMSRPSEDDCTWYLCARKAETDRATRDSPRLSLQADPTHSFRAVPESEMSRTKAKRIGLQCKLSAEDRPHRVPQPTARRLQANEKHAAKAVL